MEYVFSRIKVSNNCSRSIFLTFNFPLLFQRLFSESSKDCNLHNTNNLKSFNKNQIIWKPSLKCCWDNRLRLSFIKKMFSWLLEQGQLCRTWDLLFLIKIIGCFWIGLIILVSSQILKNLAFRSNFRIYFQEL